MENDLLKSIKAILEELEPMTPINTGVEPTIGRLDAKAVIFDIYGTLLISDSGDVMEARFLTSNLQKALDKAGIRVNPVEDKTREELLTMILDEFRASVARQHRNRRKNNIPYPEINIIDTWEAVINYSYGKGWLEPTKYCNCRILSYVFELLSNKIWPMPGMKGIINDFLARGIPLGIVSNAQAYTPVFMNYYLNDIMDVSEVIEPFDPRITIYSFKEKRAKPDHYLFDKLADSLRINFNIEPKDSVYIGNDMLNDIFAAQEVGFKTILFAGDRRSLRWREGNDKIKDISPDFIITELNQLNALIT